VGRMALEQGGGKSDIGAGLRWTQWQWHSLEWHSGGGTGL